MSTGLLTLAAGGKMRAHGGFRLRLERGERKPSASSASAAVTPGPPALVRTATRRPRGSGHQASARAQSNSSSLVSARMTPARRKAALYADSRPARAPVWLATAARPLAQTADLEGEDGLFLGNAACLGDKAPPVADPFEIEGDDVGVRIGGDGSQDIGFGHVHLVTHTNQAREPETLPARPVDDHGADGARLADEGDVAGGRAGRRQEGRIQRQVGVEHANAVGANEPHAVAARNDQTLLFQLRSIGASLAEAAAGDDGGADTTVAAFGQRRRNGRGWNEDDGEIDRVGGGSNRLVDGSLE
jgi:hypothetical protein